ncbi:unnamed protein product [Adineta steineri]|uniref:RING-type E3 ubiquitin transferase n=1 Tax=Adineta steineri TaxID=433720 RepID=A0A814VQ77_9BILA|nr:unnamed protein product [Adineta steineri]CAF4024982.1 unnamed protein product [Adineta steineri]
MANEVNTENDAADVDICRVCRCEGSLDRPLFYPCLCHGSIRYVHDDCLIQWLRISRKDECELCGTKFRFTPIYHPSMPPGRLPLKDLINGLLRTFFKALRYWLHYVIVAFCWLGVVPITASRIYRCLFAGSISSILTLPYDIVSTDHILTDVLQGGLVVFCSLGAFICLLWLREQILTGGGPAWLQPADPEPARQAAAAAAAAAAVAPPLQANGIAPILPVDAIPLLLPPPLPPAPLPVEPDPVNPEQPIPQNEVEHEEVAFVDAIDDEDDDDEDEDGEEEQANLIAQPAIVAGNAQNAEHNHNWIDWDRAADDLTWERLLGLDGSLQFLEHVFWVVTLNTLFILIFAYAPYHLGKIIISSKTFKQTIADTRFTIPINTLTTYGCVNAFIGYFFISFVLLITFTILSFVNYLTRIRRLVGLAYIVLKVALLVILEILLFPFICGIWLDVCSLRILNERTVTLNDRLTQFQTSPGTSTFLHWLCGMVFVFYFATFIFLLREVVRPGALWFLKSINDLDFNPIQEMIQLPLALHLRRFATSIIVFGFVIILMFYVPSELLIRCIPRFLPFNVKGSLETVVSELMIEFILLQGILPTLLEQGHTRTMLKYLLQLWVELASWLLGLRSFLLGDASSPTITNTPRVDQNDNVLPLPVVNVPDQVEQVPPVQTPTTPSSSAQTFIEPTFFRLRLVGLCLFTCLSLAILSILGLTIPATIGRCLLGLVTGSAKLHELYTILTGLYILWLISRIIFFIRSLLPFDINNILTRLKSYSILCLRVVMCTFCVIGYVPFMIGLASELVLIIPLSTSIEQTAVLTPLRVWIIGLLNTKIAIALIMSGPQWRLKAVLERLYQDGLRRIDFSFLINEFLLPFTLNIGMFMAFPYLAVSYMAPSLFYSTTVHQIERYIYSAIISFMLLLAFVIFQIKQLRLLFEHVRDEKYLVGRRLINFER